MFDLASSLNAKQLEAVTLPCEHALILAGAGSGKTRVLTTRIAWLISEGHARPWQILAVTFTNKAAKEMRTRLSSMLVGVDVSSMWVGTFHGIAHKLLRLHASEAGLPKTFQIIDSADQLSLIKRIMKEMGIDTDQHDPKLFQNLINKFKESGLRARDVRVGEMPPKGNGIYSAYEERCQREGLVDFAELLLRSVELLEHNAPLRMHYAARLKFLLIDEFQDTNALQFRWIKTIAKPESTESTVFCVGDDDQSIYAFRGARVGNMDDFVKEFSVRHVVKLEQNYRSTSHILDAANAVIANNTKRIGKNLWTSAGAGEPITVYHAADDRDEARSITQEILSMHRSGRDYAQFAVLYRNNAQSRVLEQYFTSNSVPYRIYGGLRFFDRQEVKDVTAYMRILTHPDDTSVLRVINHPPRGIGATTLTRVADWASEHGRGLWDAIIEGKAADVDLAFTKAHHFVSVIEKIREAAVGKSLPEVVSLVIELSGLKEYYSNQRDKDIRLENMQEIVNAATGYCSENGIDDDLDAFEVVEGGEMSAIDGFLAQAVLESEDKNEEEMSDAVQMMTVHASKGLEFDNVYLCGLEEGLFPHAPRGDEDAEKALSEERRLMYVAMTRARKKLCVSWCESRMLYGERRFNNCSRFVEEIPESHTHEVVSKFLQSEDEEGTSGFGGYGNGYRRETSGWKGRSQESQWGWQRERLTGAKKPAGSFGGQVRRASDFLNPSQATQSVPQFVKSTKSTGQTNFYGINAGDRVTHRKFGEGEVIQVTDAGSEMQAIARVKFRIGVKELLLRFAKLEKVLHS